MQSLWSGRGKEVFFGGATNRTTYFLVFFFSKYLKDPERGLAFVKIERHPCPLGHMSPLGLLNVEGFLNMLIFSFKVFSQETLRTCWRVQGREETSTTRKGVKISCFKVSLICPKITILINARYSNTISNSYGHDPKRC